MLSKVAWFELCVFSNKIQAIMSQARKAYLIWGKKKRIKSLAVIASEWQIPQMIPTVQRNWTKYLRL